MKATYGQQRVPSATSGLRKGAGRPKKHAPGAKSRACSLASAYLTPRASPCERRCCTQCTVLGAIFTRLTGGEVGETAWLCVSLGRAVACAQSLDTAARTPGRCWRGRVRTPDLPPRLPPQVPPPKTRDRALTEPRPAGSCKEPGWMVRAEGMHAGSGFYVCSVGMRDGSFALGRWEGSAGCRHVLQTQGATVTSLSGSACGVENGMGVPASAFLARHILSTLFD